MAAHWINRTSVGRSATVSLSMLAVGAATAPAALAAPSDPAETGSTVQQDQETGSPASLLTTYVEPTTVGDAATPPVVDFGLGKPDTDEEAFTGLLDLKLTGAGPLAGATFDVQDTATDPGPGDPAADCTTDASGQCLTPGATLMTGEGFPLGPWVYPQGTYTITQLTAPTGASLPAGPLPSVTVTVAAVPGQPTSYRGVAFTSVVAAEVPVPPAPVPPGPQTGTDPAATPETPAPVPSLASPATRRSGTGDTAATSTTVGTSAPDATSSPAGQKTVPAAAPARISPAPTSPVASPWLTPVADEGSSGLAGQPGVVIGFGAALLAFTFFFLLLRRRQRRDEG
jgi:hypothetical protein